MCIDPKRHWNSILFFSGDFGKVLTRKDDRTNKLIGIVSNFDKKSCGTGDGQMFTDVTKHYQWIIRMIFES